MSPPALSWDEDDIVDVFGSECSKNDINDYYVTKVAAEDQFLDPYIGDAEVFGLEDTDVQSFFATANN
ncbi:hypothetical protein PAXRUDRAFT_15302 [Paxillus rubicundulus Ve08.2h10]|uniref:Uncharacterized protein n=1 Tax=Paxillus rubicundulus Ve08.2h10 TaxID=930991 RepID=A0A0D0D039_9AGAM|nr:hypothetical protein PAXRUDRAFT_15302 [Paxillus rubicundulus Ve08.2h10]